MVKGTDPKEYVTVEVDKWDIDQLHPEEAPLVAAAYLYVLEAPEGTGLSTVTTVFNHFGVTTVNGNPWDLPKVEKVLRRGRNAGFLEHMAKGPVTGKKPSWSSQVLDAEGMPNISTRPRLRGRADVDADIEPEAGPSGVCAAIPAQKGRGP